MVTFFTLILFAASFIVLLAAAGAWRRRRVPGGVALTLLLVSVGVWCFFAALETTSLNEQQRYLWSALSYIGLCNVTPFLAVFALQYSDAGWPLSGWTYAAMWSVPAATLVLAFTNGLHHLIWTGITPGPVAGTNTVIYSHGWWYWLEMAWFLGLSLLASYHLLRVAIRTARLYALQGVVLLACIVIPWVGLVLFVLPNGPVPGLDTTSLGFAVSAVLMLTAFSRLRFMDLVPQARATLVEHMTEGFFVLDDQDRIIDFNPTACRLLRVEPPAIGSGLEQGFPALKDLGGRGAHAEVRLLNPFPDRDIAVELSISPLQTRSGREAGQLFLVRDVTDRRRNELEREKLIAELREALSRVKTLSGLLPICASCKKIRDDKGYWHQVENYMKDHAEVEFSHGICPECEEKLYPEQRESSQDQED